MSNPFSKNKKSKRERKVRNAPKSTDLKVNSYASPAKRRTRDKLKQHKRSRSRFRKYAIRVAIIGAIIIGTGAFIWSNLRINNVIMSGSGEQYIEVIEQYLNRNPVANLKPLVSTKAIAKDILGSHPEVSNVLLEIPVIGERIEVRIVIREDQLVLKTGDGDYYVVDQDGYAYAKYDEKNGFKGVIVLSDDTAVVYESDTIGQFVAPSLVEFIQLVNKGLSANSTYEGQSFSYRLTDEARVLYAKPSKSKYEIKFQQNLPVEQQINNLNNVLVHLSKKAISPQKYIDVRLNGTVYYR